MHQKVVASANAHPTMTLGPKKCRDAGRGANPGAEYRHPAPDAVLA